MYNQLMNTFLPNQIAELTIEAENEKGKIWEYIPQKGVFYNYDYDKGYWQETNEEFLKGSIRKKLLEINPKWGKNHKINEVLTALKHETMEIEGYEKFNIGLNADTDLINVKNGMLDWKTLELKEHDPGYFSQMQLPIEYDSEAQCPLWKKALQQWLPDNKTREFIQEYVGYCLIPDTSQQVSVFLYGSGSNGKSTFLEVISQLFGPQILSNIPLHRIGNRFETVYLQDKLVNICTDIDPGYIKNTGTIKTLIHGEHTRGEYKNGISFGFIPVVRMFFSANELPRVRDKSNGWYRSFEYVEFPNSFKKSDDNYDSKLKQKLIKELPGIFNWALAGLKRMKQTEIFSSSKEMKKNKNKYKAHNDTVSAFLQEKAVMDKEAKIVGKKFHENYQRYCEKQGLDAQSRKTFTRILKQKGIKSKNAHIPDLGKTVKCYCGVKLR